MMKIKSLLHNAETYESPACELFESESEGSVLSASIGSSTIDAWVEDPTSIDL